MSQQEGPQAALAVSQSSSLFSQILRLFVTLVILAGVAWAVGVRVHPEVLQARFAKTEEGAWVQVELKVGSSFVGKLEKDRGDEVDILVQGGSFAFTRDEIQKITQLSNEDIQNLKRGQALQPQKPFVTFRSEDSLFQNVTKKKKQTRNEELMEQGRELTEMAQKLSEENERRIGEALKELER